MMLGGRVALVTGGGRNIGREVCLALAREGSDVVVNVRTDQAAADGVAAEVRALGRRATAVAADVSDAEAVRAMVGRIRSELGRIDTLVCCAAQRGHVRFLEMTDEQWREVRDTIVGGAINTCRAVIPLMIEQGSGSIVLVSGSGAFTGTWSHAGAAKMALHGLARGLAREFGPRGVRCNVVVPSTIETQRARPQPPERVAAELAATPLGRHGKPREVADVCVFLASDMSSFVTGQAIHVNGGQVMP